ncbi:MAG: alanine/glycine:cation symporter family protein [Verrucomicrobiales bacterium]
MHASACSSLCASENQTGIDQQIDQAFKPAAEVTGKMMFSPIPIFGQEIPWVILWLGLGAVFLTFYFKFINVHAFGLAIRTVKGKYSKSDDPGQITHFQALASALSGTVGLGNIGGVAVAISFGGPGAVFWMILIGFFSMSTKFAECTLGVKYRKIDEDGTVRGGPMYYLQQGLKDRGMKGLGRCLAIIAAITFIFGAFGAGNMYQTNQSCALIYDVVLQQETSDGKWIFGVIMAILVGSVIIGGIKRVAAVTSKLVPSMCIIYLLGCLVVLLSNISSLPAAFSTIFDEAFAPKSAMVGGIVGVFIQGMRRATFSNEAGLGSAPVAHSAVKTSKPASEGIVALLEPFIDTIIVCTMTALVIISTGVYEVGDEIGTGGGILLTSEAFSTVIPWFKYILMVAVFLFAFSTMITWSYYGEQAIAYLFGPAKKIAMTYKILFCSFAIVGSSSQLDNVLNFCDATLFMMCVPNLIGVYLLLPVIRKELSDFTDHAKSIDAADNS